MLRGGSPSRLLFVHSLQYTVAVLSPTAVFPIWLRTAPRSFAGGSRAYRFTFISFLGIEIAAFLIQFRHQHFHLHLVDIFLSTFLYVS